MRNLWQVPYLVTWPFCSWKEEHRLKNEVCSFYPLISCLKHFLQLDFVCYWLWVW
jgi:hypothetical protein